MQYKVCYNQVVTELREDTEKSGPFDLPPEPLMETCAVKLGQPITDASQFTGVMVSGMHWYPRLVFSAGKVGAVLPLCQE